MSESRTVPEGEIRQLANALKPLIGCQLDVLKLPRDILAAFEPSQIGTIAGTLMDACIPQLDKLVTDQSDLFGKLGIEKHEGILKDREGYPDYKHKSGLRLELKLLYVDPDDAVMKTVATRREPSARISQKVTVKNVVPETDLLLLVVYQLQPMKDDPDLYTPTIVDFCLFPMIECVNARDSRLEGAGGRWFGNYETPVILSRIGRNKVQEGALLNETVYGRKESEGHDFNEDTNFGKLKRIPYMPLQAFLRDHNTDYSRTGCYPEAWALD
jgi:hypothetical protein